MLKPLADVRQNTQGGTAENKRKFPPAELRPKGWIPKPDVLPQYKDSDSDNNSNKENKLFFKDNNSDKKPKFR
jgi:hypothetical protein